MSKLSVTVDYPAPKTYLLPVLSVKQEKMNIYSWNVKEARISRMEVTMQICW